MMPREDSFMNFRIKKLDIFVVRQFGLLFVGTFFICQFVLMMQFLWRYINVLIGKGLSLDVMAQFLWYMALMLVPQALPLAILLSSLITFGNLGESSELTAIKSAGISLMQTFRSLIVVSVMICLGSFYFQNQVGPNAYLKISQLLVSMKQKSPELEIPEGVFYDGIPNCNIYVQKKDLKTGKLYGIMIYRMTNSFEDAAIILADSGMLQSTAEKKHLLLTLWSGEWFENMQSQELSTSAAVPYRRESFVGKRIVLDFDGDFNMTDASLLSSDARSKSLAQIRQALDSLNNTYDSVGRAFYADAQRLYYQTPVVPPKDSAAAIRRGLSKDFNIDKLLEQQSRDQKQQIYNEAVSRVQNELSDLEFKAMITKDNDRLVREHEIEAINKFTLALQCLLFFFIGAPLGAIIRKGGLGVPVIVSVAVFIVYYILDNVGYRMARQGTWDVWFGKTLALCTLAPAAVFITYKACKDSMVFNADLWRSVFMKAFGLREKRHIAAKEIIIHEPQYKVDATRLRQISAWASDYAREHNLKSPPNLVKVFFKYQPDHEIERIGGLLDEVIEDLSNTRDRQVLHDINCYPVLAVKAHTRPFEKRWLNIASALIVPLGVFFYCRMWRFRLRLYHDLQVIRNTNSSIANHVEKTFAGGRCQWKIGCDTDF